MALSPNYRGWLRGTTDGVNAVARGQNRVMFGDNTAVLTEGANPNAFLMGHGTSSSRVTATTAGNFLSFYTESSATSGDTRGMYLRTYFSGAAGGGEAARIFGTVQNVAAGTARGAHISLSFGDTGTVTGLGAAVEATLHLPNTTPLAGTMTAVNAAINADGATTDPAGATSLSFIRAVLQGNATGMADVDDDAVLIDLSGMTIGSGNLVEASTTEANYAHSIRIRLPDGSLGYLMVASAAG